MSNTDKTLSLKQISTLFKGFFQFKKLAFSHSLYQGGSTPVIERELFARGEAVVVLLYDDILQKVVMVEQCRVGAVQHALANGKPEQAWLIEPVAGMIDPGESAEQAALREIEEETGYQWQAQQDELFYISHYYPSPGACDEILWLYAAKIDASKIQGFSGLAHEHEDIKVISLDYQDAKKKLQDGCFNVASTILALQWLFYQK